MKLSLGGKQHSTGSSFAHKIYIHVNTGYNEYNCNIELNSGMSLKNREKKVCIHSDFKKSRKCETFKKWVAGL